MPRAALGLHVLDPVEPGMVVFPHPPLVDVDDLVDVLDAVLDLDDLVHLLLVARHHEARPAMVEDVGHLLGHRVLVERDGNRTRRLCGHHRPVELRTVPPDDRDMVALREPEREEAQGQRPDLGLGLAPGPALPDAEFLLAIRRPPAQSAGVPGKERRNGDEIALKRLRLGQRWSSLHRSVPAVPVGSPTLATVEIWRMRRLAVNFFVTVSQSLRIVTAAAPPFPETPPGCYRRAGECGCRPNARTRR
jgi:hypothetical protein